jgi:8-oxo-dGTP pyrophosphatase MutT (NUDIX family)
VTRPELLRKLQEVLTAQTATTSDFDLNADVALAHDRLLTSAAVLVCVTLGGDVILTKRSTKLKNHPGQVAFPGGKMDPEDRSIEAAALREAQEEIRLPPNDVQILGRLPEHETVTRFAVTPVVGLLNNEFVASPEEGEVSEVFRVPLSHFLTLERYQIQSRRWQGAQRYYYTIPFGPYYVWGATARILFGLAQRWHHGED